jgi:HD-GYP domain-containing protein (c-di-GMP phosphodiesterase class II)
MKKEDVTTPIPELVERLKAFHEEALTYTEKLKEAQAIEESQRKQLQKAYQDFERIYIDTICTLADAIDARSKYTRGHSSRVRHYVEMMGKELNLTKEELNTLCMAATLHDIGRMGIDNAIWEKPGELTKEEYEVVKSYPSESADILASIAFLESVSKIVRHHRENYDGSGYPDGLKGDEIPLGSRILSVADAFDAMTSERPYRDRIDPEVAIEELQNKAGTQFDSKMVETFISIWTQMYK